jgi:protein TonB
MRAGNSQALSLGLHGAAVGVLLFLTSRSIESPPRARDAVGVIAPLRWRPPPAAADRSGGSNRTSLPARRGAAPPRARRTFVPPSSAPQPKLPMAITVVFDTPSVPIDMSAIGDPASNVLVGVFGNKGGSGIGNRPDGAGIGHGGSGPPGISSSAGRGRLTPPLLIFEVEPEFSEEARKAKYQGTVLLAIEVDTSGRPVNIRVLQGLGMGLDEKAIEAVSRWRFRPGLRDGRAVVTSATVQVSFRLL